MTHLLTFAGSGNEAAALATDALQKAGLQVVLSFDLNAARAAHADCSCPYHGTALCACQMIVLLVYGDDGPPATLTTHTCDGRTQLILVNDPGQRPSPDLETTITGILLPAFLSPMYQEIHS